jgi:hypothetical protein
MRRFVWIATTAAVSACASSPPRARLPAAQAVGPPAPKPATPQALAPSWPEALGGAMQGRGAPHMQPLPLPRDSSGRERWLAFVGPPELALGAWRVARAPDGVVDAEPVERWPTGVRVLGGVVTAGVAYVLLESTATLDQPGGLRGVWVDASGRSSPFDSSPLSLADVKDIGELADRTAHPPLNESPGRTALGLLTTLRAAGTSAETLGRCVSTQGADVATAWQSIFTQRVGRLEAAGSPSPLVDRVLGVVRAAATTQACGADACEVWTDGGRAVVRFAVEGGRWVIREVIEDAPLPQSSTRVGPPHEVEPAADSSATDALLRSRARAVKQVLGEAPLTAGGGTIGVAMVDLASESPVVATREEDAARVFPIDIGPIRAAAADIRAQTAFADVDGDGRTDAVLRLEGKRADGTAVAWIEAFLAPPASVQATTLEPDLASALAMMDAADARSAARAAAAMPVAGVAREDACRMLVVASTPAGFRRVAAPDARVLLFEEPGLPTWLPKSIPASKVTADDVRSIGSHCAELTCSASRPYCSWTGGADSQHAWFGWREGKLVLLGVADYHGE